jgi:hypothetical protein
MLLQQPCRLFAREVLIQPRRRSANITSSTASECTIFGARARPSRALEQELGASFAAELGDAWAAACEWVGRVVLEAAHPMAA